MEFFSFDSVFVIRTSSGLVSFYGWFAWEWASVIRVGLRWFGRIGFDPQFLGRLNLNDPRIMDHDLDDSEAERGHSLTHDLQPIGGFRERTAFFLIG